MASLTLGVAPFLGSRAAFPNTLTTYAFNWGDGSAVTTGASPVAQHVYAAAGTKTITLTVTSSNGQTATTTANVTVT